MSSPSLALARQNSAQPAPTLWDVANIFEYATSRFAVIQESLDKSRVSRTPHYREQFVQHLVWEADPCLPVYLKQIVKMLMSWQVGALDNPGLFHEFATHHFDTSGDLMVRYQNVRIYQYTWWKDRFDLMPFEVPNRITMREVLLLCNTHMQQTWVQTPCSTISRVIRDDLKDLGTKLEDWLADKIKDGSTALEEMTSLEGPVDDLHDAMAASQQLLDANRGHPASGS
ncbi:hypothetical protein F4604DRAFT_1685566 [Suillus subluteus]|nr:hypothetical protein F4604DRAFT_1685566 [Suillus subluteus]